MPVRTFQTAFTAGELTPQLHARADFPRITQGAERLKNVIVRPHGGASRRPGAYFIADTYDVEARSWLYPFIFSNQQAYVLEFAPERIRVFQDRRILAGDGDGVELATNGTFATDLAGWTVTNGGTGATAWNASGGGVARLTGGASGSTRISQAVTTAVGDVYVVDWFATWTITLGVGTSDGDTSILQEFIGAGAHRRTFTATTTTAWIQFTTDEDALIDLDTVTVQAAAPVEVVTPYTADQIPALRFAQSADVLYICHPDVQPQKLLRISAVEWETRPVTLSPPPTRELPQTYDGTLTPGATTGQGVTFTASGTPFIASDINKVIRGGAGRASIITVTSSSAVEADVFDAFASTDPLPAAQWFLIGSPSSTVTPTFPGGLTVTPPAGTSIVLTADIATWRATDVGSYVRINAGFAQINDVQSDTVAGAIVMLSPSSDDPALPGAWALEQPIWTDARGWPGACCFHDQRLVMGGSPSDPLGFAASVTSDYENFTLGPNDDDAYDYELVGAFNVIRALISQRSLIALTPGAEHVVSGGDNSTPHITPTSIHAQTDTAYGCAYAPAPLHVGNAVLFVQRGGTRIRELTYDFGTDARVAPDLGMLAEHLMRAGVVQIVRQTSPDSVVFALRSDGALLACAYERPEQVVAWSRWITGEAQDLTDGFYESVCVIPNACDTGDEVWVTVRRRLLVSAPAATLTPDALTGVITFTASAAVFEAGHVGRWITSLNTNGIAVIDTVTDSTHVEAHSIEDFEGLDAIVAGGWDLCVTTRNVELFDYAVNVDAAVVSTGAAITSLAGLDHLDGDTVTVVADGVDSTAVVTDGAITVSGTDVQAGINYLSRIRTLRPEVNAQGGLSMARIRRMMDAVVRFYCCGPGWRINQLETDLTGGETRRDDLNVDTGFIEYVQDRLVANLGWDRQGRITVEQPRPFQGTVLAIGGRLEVEDDL